MIKFKVILFSYLSLFMFGIVDNMRGPLYPDLIASWGVSQKVGALFFALSSLCGFLFGIKSSDVLKKIGVRKLFFIGMFLMFLSLFICYFAFHFMMILVGTCCLGLSMGMLGLSQNTLVSYVSEEHNNTRLMSGLHTMYALASLLAPAIYNFILFQFSSHHSQHAFLFLALSSLLVFLITFFFFPPFEFEETSEIENQKDTSFRLTQGLNFSKKYLITIAISLYVVSEVLIGTRLPLFLQQNFNLNAASSNYYLLGCFAAFFLGRIIMSFIEIKKQRSFLLIILFLSGLGYFLSLYVHPILWVGTAFFQAPFYPVGLAFLKSESKTQVAKYIAITITTTALLLMFSHVVFGLISDYYDSFVAMHLGLFVLMISMILFFQSSKQSRVE